MFDLNLEDIFTAGAFEYALKRLKRTALGLDGLNAEDICSDVFYAELKSEIFSLSYSPQPLKRAFIPKEAKDELRKLAVPSLKDKFAQNILLVSFQAILIKAFQTALMLIETANPMLTPYIAPAIFFKFSSSPSKPTSKISLTISITKNCLKFYAQTFATPVSLGSSSFGSKTEFLSALITALIQKAFIKATS